MLRRYLPIYRYLFDGACVIDTGSTDGTYGALQDQDCIFKTIAWTNYSVARNASLALAEANGYDYAFVIDPDEAILPDRIEPLRALLDGSVYTLPRFEFIQDERHINSNLYPDLHVRIIPLHQGIEYRGVIHEVPYFKKDSKSISELGKSVIIPWMPIFHYGRLKSPNEIALHYQNMYATAHGKPRSDVLTSDVPASYSHGPVIPYIGETPI